MRALSVLQVAMLGQALLEWSARATIDAIILGKRGRVAATHLRCAFALLRHASMLKATESRGSLGGG